jgi:chromosome segregation protein
MRFTSLDLLRYGKFSGRHLEFRADAGLHIVYGPNEAGKSSALSAISDLLFGFPDRDFRYGFGHDNRDLRVGAELVARNGTEIRFRRRKARKNALVAATDAEEPLPDDALSPYLGTLGRDVFERAFGLDTDALRKGADIMLHSSGEIGSLLFSAASGMMGMRDLRQKLDQQADGIFAERKSQNRLFYQVLDRYEAARKAEREHTLRADVWKKLSDARAELDAKMAALASERKETGHAIERLSRLKRWKPLIDDIDAETRALEAFADLGGMEDDAADRLRQLLERQERLKEAIARLEAEARERAAKLEGLEVDDGMLAASGRIQELYRELGNYNGLRKDLPAVDRELAQHEAKLSQLSRQLGLAGLEELEAKIPDEISLTELRRLAEQGRELQRRRMEANEAVTAERETLERLTEDRATHLIDPKPWRDQLATLAPDIEDVAKREQMAVQVARLAEDLRAMLGRMRPSVDALDRLAAAPLPDPAEIAAFGERLAAARNLVKEALRERDRIAASLAELDDEMQRLGAGTTMVTQSDICAAREKRDADLRLLAEASNSQMPAEPAAVNRLADRIADADRLSDAALADAERLSRHAALAQRRERLTGDLQKAEATVAKSEAALSAEKDAYEALFRDCEVAPLDPEAMLAWRRSLDLAFERQREIDALKDRCAVVDRLEEKLLPAMKAIAAGTGLAAVEALPAVALGRALQRHLGELADRWQESRTLEGEKSAARRRLEMLEAQKAALETEERQWRAPFAAAVARLGYPDGISAEAILAGLDLWARVPDALVQRQSYMRRVAGINRDIGTFEKAVLALVSEIAPDLAATNAAAAVETLTERAATARSRNEARLTLTRSLEEGRQKLEDLRRKDDLTAADLQAMTIAGQGEGDGRALLRRLDERETRRLRLAEARERFHQQSEGVDEAEARAALDGFDPVDAGLSLERLTAESEAQYRTFGELNAALADNRAAREAAETGESAEMAAFEKRAAEEDARELARRWAVIRLASDILQSSLDSYRQSQADPMILRAGERFSSLTDGAFVRLLQDYDDKDELQLLAERANGEKVPLSGLSEGTGDQLYLALRLAFLEDYCSRNEPVPLIADDIFQTFDDERTAAGLKTLALGAGTFQTVLFTHQQSVVDIAGDVLGKAVDVIRL